MEWNSNMDEALAVGKKRHLFLLANGKQVTGYRQANDRRGQRAYVVPEFANNSFLAVAWMPLPPPSEAPHD